MLNTPATMTDTTDIANLDPNTVVTVPVFCPANAGKKVPSRFGAVVFDGDGNGEVKLPLHQLRKLDELQWMTPETREKYLGIALPEEEAPIVAEARHLTGELEATKQANIVLATKNADLEARLIHANNNFDREWKSAMAQIEQLQTTLAQRETELAEAKQMLTIALETNVQTETKVIDSKDVKKEEAAKKEEAKKGNR
jgi:hypothetical protein